MRRERKNIEKIENKDDTPKEPLTVKDEALRFLMVIFALFIVCFAFHKINENKAAEVPKQIIDAAPVEEQLKTLKKDVPEKTAAPDVETTKAQEVTTDATETKNIDSANDYINFERLIMQLSEYTDPDKIQDTDEDISGNDEYTSEEPTEVMENVFED